MEDNAKKYRDRNTAIVEWYKNETQKVSKFEKNPDIQKRKFEELSKEMHRRMQESLQSMEKEIAQSSAKPNLKEVPRDRGPVTTSQRKSKSKRKDPTVFKWQLRGSIKGDVVSWTSPTTLMFLRDKRLFRYDLKAKTETELGAFEYNSAHFPRSSNEFAYFSISRNGKTFDAKIDWREPFKEPERVKDISGGMIYEATGSFEGMLSPFEKPGQTRYGSTDIQRVWGTDFFFDYQPVKPSHDKSEKHFPLNARVFDRAGNILQRFQIPAGPWVWRHSIIDAIKHFSCGPSCYAHFKAFMIDQTIFASAYGKAVPKKGVGFFVLEGDKWQRLSDHGGSTLIVDETETRLAVSSGEFTSLFFQ